MKFRIGTHGTFATIEEAQRGCGIEQFMARPGGKGREYQRWNEQQIFEDLSSGRVVVAYMKSGEEPILLELVR